MNMGKIRKQIEQSLLGEDKINMGTTSVGGVYI